VSIYDKAHEMGDELASSEEYQEFLAARAELIKEPVSLQLLEAFRRLQWEIQRAEFSGENPSPSQLEELERFQQTVTMNPIVDRYLTAEFRLARMMREIQEIVVEKIQIWFEQQQNDRLN